MPVPKRIRASFCATRLVIIKIAAGITSSPNGNQVHCEVNLFADSSQFSCRSMLSAVTAILLGTFMFRYTKMFLDIRDYVLSVDREDTSRGVSEFPSKLPCQDYVHDGKMYIRYIALLKNDS